MWSLSVSLQPPARPVLLWRKRQLSHPKYTLLWLPLAVIFSHSHRKATHAYKKVIPIPALEHLMSFTVKDVLKGPTVLQNRKMQQSFWVVSSQKLTALNLPIRDAEHEYFRGFLYFYTVYVYENVNKNVKKPLVCFSILWSFAYAPFYRGHMSMSIAFQRLQLKTAMVSLSQLLTSGWQGMSAEGCGLSSPPRMYWLTTRGFTSQQRSWLTEWPEIVLSWLGFSKESSSWRMKVSSITNPHCH